MSDKPVIESLEIDDLLRDLEGRADRPPSLIEMWLDSQGYYPGTSRMTATELLEIFQDWYRVRPELSVYPLPGPTAFGMEMGRRFKRGRGSRGNFYYISRKKDPSIPRNLLKGKVRESGGAGDPVPPAGPKRK